MKIVIDDNIKVRTCPHCFTQFVYDVSRDVSIARDMEGKKFLTVICPGCHKDIEEQYSIRLKFILDQWRFNFL